jgi:hypothetical protein
MLPCRVAGRQLGGAQTQSTNYDESKVGTYTLPDPLIFNNGKPVRNAHDWERRRHEILELFATNVYGHSPRAPKRIRFDVFDIDKNALRPIGRCHGQCTRGTAPPF